MVPAEASAPLMNETGPLAVPPPRNCSFEERSDERFRPDPEPPLKMIPSSTYQLRIERMVSSTERMKHAEHCGLSSQPTLNQTGELNAALWVTRRWVSSSAKVLPSASLAKYPSLAPQPWMVSTTRPIIWRTEDSRCGVPRGPRKYFCATMLVAFWDQALGNSTPRCSNALPPSLKFGMTASLTSHSTSSKGCSSSCSTGKGRLPDTPRWGKSGGKSQPCDSAPEAIGCQAALPILSHILWS